MNLNEAEIAVTTKRLVTVNPKKSYRMELADYCDIDEFHHACATRFPEEAEPEYRYTDWENIPEYMVSSEWLCPSFFEVRDAMERLAGRVSAGLFRAVVRTLRLQPGDGRSAPARILLSGQSPCTDGCAGGGRTRCGGGQPGLSGDLFLLFIRDELPV